MANGKVRIGRCLLKQGLYEEAEALLLPSHAALAAQFGESHPDVREARSLIAELPEKLD